MAAIIPFFLLAGLTAVEFHKLTNFHAHWTRINDEIQNGKDGVLRTITNLRGHHGLSIPVLRSQTAILINTLRYSKWHGDLDDAKLVNKALPEDTTALLDRIAYLVSEIQPPYQARAQINGQDRLPFKSKVVLYFMEERWMSVIAILKKITQELENEVVAANNRITVDTAAREG